MNCTKSRGQHGFTLIETMVTILILSVGLLGFAGLLTKSIVANRQAYYRSQATFLAHDIAERMRANRVEAVAGGYNTALNSAVSTTSFAGEDMAGWKTNVADYLPEGDAVVSVDTLGNVGVVIHWNDANDGTSKSFTTQTTI
ncbi:type IV pilus modification protein PilV [Rhodoferax sp.]|uniref:type IV pilus modification protein PilV n=1 Tax=Rhodoferax sp. TaxID=50421 RepID=UPI002603F2C5|nr:type IV pilus modification protein PilV [Rhodoferax sp.]MDD3937833.1 type IV pilus modification protein PilV [Rhodoferax sp.]